MTEATVRPYRAGDETALVDLFYRSYGRRITEDHWRWKLRGRPSTVDNVWLVPSINDNPVFQYAGIPSPFSLSQHRVTSMLAVDAMTAPEFRRLGLLTRSVPAIHAAWREGGIAFVIGLPNNQWGSRTGVLGWQPLFPLQWLIRPLRPSSLVAERLKLPFLRRLSGLDTQWNRFLQGRLQRDAKLYTERVCAADDAFDRVWELCQGNAMFSTVRDRAWVDWRFLAAPSRKYVVTLAHRASGPVGYSAHCLIETERRTTAVLADMLIEKDDHTARDTLLYELIESLRETKAQTLATLAVPGTAQFRWLRSAGFLPRQAFSVDLVPLIANLPVQAMRSGNNWNLSGADFDVV